MYVEIPSDFFDDDGVNERDDAACHVSSDKSAGFAPSFSIIHSPFSILAQPFNARGE